MKISEIKDKALRELAELRRKEDGRSSDSLIRAFVRDDTLEGQDYWEEVCIGTITTPPILKMEWDNSKVNENLLKENENLEKQIEDLEKQIEDLEVINSRWKEEMDLQLKYSAWERKEKHKLIKKLKI